MWFKYCVKTLKPNNRIEIDDIYCMHNKSVSSMIYFLSLSFYLKKNYKTITKHSTIQMWTIKKWNDKTVAIVKVPWNATSAKVLVCENASSYICGVFFLTTEKSLDSVRIFVIRLRPSLYIILNFMQLKNCIFFLNFFPQWEDFSYIRHQVAGDCVCFLYITFKWIFMYSRLQHIEFLKWQH